MKNAMNDEQAVLEFLESAGMAMLENRRLQRRLDSLKDRRDALQSRRSKAARKLKEQLEAEYKRELDVMERELDSYRRVEEFIARLPGSVHRMILRRRYLETWNSWNEVQMVLAADGLNYSLRHLGRLHMGALEKARLLWIREREEESNRERR